MVSGMEGEEEEQGSGGGMGEEESQMGEMQGSMESTREEESQGESMASEASTSEQAPSTSRKKSGGRRAALKIVRENVEGVSRDLAAFRKASDASAKRLEKQMAQLRSDISALKSHVAKEASRAREKQESLSTKLLAKMSQKPKSVAAPKKKSGGSSSSSKKSKSKGKK